MSFYKDFWVDPPPDIEMPEPEDCPDHGHQFLVKTLHMPSYWACAAHDEVGNFTCNYTYPYDKAGLATFDRKEGK